MRSKSCEILDGFIGAAIVFLVFGDAVGSGAQEVVSVPYLGHRPAGQHIRDPCIVVDMVVHDVAKLLIGLPGHLRGYRHIPLGALYLLDKGQQDLVGHDENLRFLHVRSSPDGMRATIRNMNRK